MSDTLSEVLAVTRLKGTVYFSAELRAPWGVALPQRPRAPFYVVTRGRCEITLDGAASGVCLGSGDLVVLPGGSAHALVSSARASAIPLEQFVARHPMDERGRLKALNGKGPTTSLIGGFFELERAPEPLVTVLPPMIHLRGDAPEVSGWLDPILRSIADEAAQTAPGRAVVLNRLADVLFVRVVRAYLLKMSAQAETGPPSWLRGLTDPRIARALAQIHRAPEQAWTLAQLASRAAMSHGVRRAFPQPRGPGARDLSGELADAEGGLLARDANPIDRAGRRARGLRLRAGLRQGVSSPHRHAARGIRPAAQARMTTARRARGSLAGSGAGPRATASRSR
jgi:hypothetical protein